MKPVFLDTVGILATLNTSDQWHDAALQAYHLLLKDQRDCLSTTFVFTEIGNATSRTTLRPLVSAMIDELTAKGRMIEPTSDDWREACLAYSQGYPGSAGLVDCISFQVMRRLGLKEVFSNDQHFASAGFSLLF